MELAILFWFYKDVEICRNRLELLKRYNPDLKIFGLYGGRKSQARIYQRALGKYFEDYYITEFSEKRSTWKWINGEKMILAWYLDRGKKLSWDSIIVVQWDMLVLGPIKQQFPGLKKGQLFLSGLRILDSFIEKRWSWTKPDSRERKNYLRFKEYLRKKYNYTNKLLCSLFILQIFPKQFFRDWSKERNNTFGMLEYTLPTFAKIFKIPFYKKDTGVWWFNKNARRGETPMNARGVQIKKSLITRELQKRNGFRIFHPYFKTWELR